MLALLFTVIIGVLNPLEQYNKANDATRQNDLNQVKTALDTYFNDTGCYPTKITFGSAWTNGNTVYMKKVPKDPDDSSHNFLYQTDGSSCPQWNVLYAALKSVSVSNTNKILCPLENMTTSCVPTDYGKTKSGYNYCMLSGAANCAYISSNGLPILSPTPTTQPTTPTPTAAFSPDCDGVSQTDVNYRRYTCNGTCQDLYPGHSGYYCNVTDCNAACP